MSQPEIDDDADDTFDPETYRTPTDVVESRVNVADGDHPIKQAYGDDAHRSFGYDPRRTGERFAFRYDSVIAWLREYISNHQTACIRAGRYLLRTEAGFDADEVAELEPLAVLEMADTHCGYNAVIEIAYSHKEAGRADVVTSDNGIGISVDEFQLVEEVGLSGSHSNGADLGQFGQGLMSGFMPVGKQGEFEWHTQSLQDGANYGERMRITGMNDLDGLRTGHGTTFRFPAVTQEVHDLDIFDEIDRLQRGYYVDIVYIEYDANGQLMPDQCEEWGHQSLADQIADSQPTIAYEDAYVEAVSAPPRSRDTSMYLVSQPIESKDTRYNHHTREAPWAFDLRLKMENGPVYQCTCDDVDHTGEIPLERPAYQSLEPAQQEMYVRKDRLGDDVVMPPPVDDKDRLENGYVEFYAAVADQLREQYRQQAVTLFEQLSADGVVALQSFSDAELTLFRKAADDFGPRFKHASPEKILSGIASALGVTLDSTTATQLKFVSETVGLAPRYNSAQSISLKRNRTSVDIQQVLQDVGSEGTVYMAKSLGSADKVRLAWALHPDNVVVHVESYDTYAEAFGWSLLKELSLYDIVDTYDAIGADHPVASLDRRNRTSGTGASGGRTSTSVFADDADGLDPAKRNIKIRTGAGQSKYFLTRESASVYELFDGENGGQLIDLHTIDRLVIYDQSEHSASAGGDQVQFGIGYAVVPGYVYEYLASADRIYESTDEALDSLPDPTVTVYDVAQVYNEHSGWLYEPTDDGCPTSVTTETAQLSELTESDCVFVDESDQLATYHTLFRGESGYVEETAMGQFCGTLDSHTSFSPKQYDRLALVSRETAQSGAVHLPGAGDAQPRRSRRTESDAPLVVRGWGITGLHMYAEGIRKKEPVDVASIALERRLESEYPPERFPRDAVEWDEILEPTTLSDVRFDILDTLDAFFPDDGTAFPSSRCHGLFDTTAFDRDGTDADTWAVLTPKHNYMDRELAKLALLRVLDDAGHMEGLPQ